MAVKSEDKSIGNIRIWYPSEMENRYPLIVVVNGSNTAALNYEPYFGLYVGAESKFRQFVL
jgi:hypothetical protein